MEIFEKNNKTECNDSFFTLRDNNNSMQLRFNVACQSGVSCVECVHQHLRSEQ